MRVYRVPHRIEAFLLDIDGTLYTNPEYVHFQSDCLIREMARARGMSYEEGLSLIHRVRSDYAAANDGDTTSLGNAMASLGVSIATSVAWRSRLIVPSTYLSADPRLRQTLQELSEGGRVAIVAVTNNPRSVGEATLDALGVHDLFLRVVGLDDTMLSKPAKEPYLLAASEVGALPESCISIGDRYEVDLKVPLSLGMGAILVDGVRDVYALPELLRRAGSNASSG